jgi:Spy/CpxP family protein refolding chaperone
MRGKLLWVLLAVSLAANVFFAAGVVYTLYTKDRLAGSPEQRIEFVADRLDLNAQQRAGLLALRERAQARFSEVRGDRGQLRDQILTELAKPEFDPARIKALLAQSSAQREPMFLETAKDMHGFLVTLSPEQRETFLTMARERGFLRAIFGSRRREARAGS